MWRSFTWLYNTITRSWQGHHKFDTEVTTRFHKVITKRSPWLCNMITTMSAQGLYKVTIRSLQGQQGHSTQKMNYQHKEQTWITSLTTHVCVCASLKDMTFKKVKGSQGQRSNKDIPLQDFSSELSPQSSTALQICVGSMHCPLSHWNWWEVQPEVSTIEVDVKGHMQGAIFDCFSVKCAWWH